MNKFVERYKLLSLCDLRKIKEKKRGGGGNEPEHTLSIPQHGRIILLIVGQTPDEPIHIKGIMLTISLLFLGRSSKVLSISVKQACHTTDKCGPNAIRMESCRANQRGKPKTMVMGKTVAATALVEAIALRPIITNSTDGVLFARSPIEAVTLNPDCVFRVLDRLDHHVGHDGRRGNS